METIKQFIPLLVLGVGTAYLTYKNTKLKKQNEEMEHKLNEAKINAAERETAKENGILALLKHELQKESRHIITRQDDNGIPYIYSAEIESINSMNRAYHALGGNGQVAALVKTVQNLKVKALAEYPL